MKVAKIAAFAAVVGIIASILVIGTPAFTTLRIAAIALVSPSEGASWHDFREPTLSELERAIARDPGDWKLRLVRARRLFLDYHPKLEAADTERARMTDFQQVVAIKPEEVVTRAAYVRWLFQQRWDFLHPADYEARARSTTSRRVLAEKPHPARRLDLVDATEAQLKELAAIEPENAAWPYLLAFCRFARLDDAGALAYLGRAAEGPRFSMAHKEELDATIDAYVSLGMPKPEAALVLELHLLFPALAKGRSVARTACALADGMMNEGRTREAAEIRMAVIDVGRLMREKGHYSLTALVGIAVEAVGYGGWDIKHGMGPSMTDLERQAAHGEWAKEREEAFLRFLESAGIEGMGPRYAHGLEEGLAYSGAARAFIETPLGDSSGQFRRLDIAYSAAPAGWVALVMTAVALILVTGGAALGRAKDVRPSNRTVVGVGTVGGVVCLVLLALAVLLTTWNLGGGLLGLRAGEPGLRFTIPPIPLVVGIVLASLIAAWALTLISGPPASRLHTVLFGVVCLALAGGYWAHVWLETAHTGPNWQGLWLIWHFLLAIVTIGGIAVVLRVWLRQEAPRVSTAVPIFAGVANFAIFCILFLSIGENLGSAGMIFLIASVPAAVAIGGLVAKIVAVARLRPSERPAYLAILRPGLAVCLAWLLVLQFASLIWLGAWRAKAAREIEEHYAVSENQAVLRIMQESREHQNP